MLRSMTGYGKITEIRGNKKISVEIKSLNSKNFNPYIKIPESINEKEIEIKNLLYESLKGGKINFILIIEDENNTKAHLNKTVINNYFKQLNEIAKENELNPKDEQILQAILRLPDILKTDDQTFDEEEWAFIKSIILKTIKEIDKFRIQEGKALETDIIQNIKNIEYQLPKIERFEAGRIETVSNRLKTKLKDFLNSDEQNKDRFEQEIIYFLDKFDLNEEKARLKNHCKYFFETLNNTDPIGAKLGFISQEIGREINTIGSKANHADIQKIVVEMKDNLGKVKEQLLNVL